MKNTPQARYHKEKVKSRRVDFYPHDQAIYEYSRSINFAKFVKDKLKEGVKNGGKSNL